MKFKIGDKVTLQENSQFMGETGNPKNKHEIGTVLEFKKEGLPIVVQWQDRKNHYGEKDLVHSIPNNILSKIMYPKLVPTDCGKYLTNPED